MPRVKWNPSGALDCPDGFYGRGSGKDSVGRTNKLEIRDGRAAFSHEHCLRRRVLRTPLGLQRKTAAVIRGPDQLAMSDTRN